MNLKQLKTIFASVALTLALTACAQPPNDNQPAKKTATQNNNAASQTTPIIPNNTAWRDVIRLDIKDEKLKKYVEEVLDYFSTKKIQADVFNIPGQTIFNDLADKLQ